MRASKYMAISVAMFILSSCDEEIDEFRTDIPKEVRERTAKFCPEMQGGFESIDNSDLDQGSIDKLLQVAQEGLISDGFFEESNDTSHVCSQFLYVNDDKTVYRIVLQKAIDECYIGLIQGKNHDEFEYLYGQLWSED